LLHSPCLGVKRLGGAARACEKHLVFPGISHGVGPLVSPKMLCDKLIQKYPRIIRIAPTCSHISIYVIRRDKGSRVPESRQVPFLKRHRMNTSASSRSLAATAASPTTRRRLPRKSTQGPPRRDPPQASYGSVPGNDVIDTAAVTSCPTTENGKNQTQIYGQMNRKTYERGQRGVIKRKRTVEVMGKVRGVLLPALWGRSSSNPGLVRAGGPLGHPRPTSRTGQKGARSATAPLCSSPDRLSGPSSEHGARRLAHQTDFVWRTARARRFLPHWHQSSDGSRPPQQHRRLVKPKSTRRSNSTRPRIQNQRSRAPITNRLHLQTSSPSNNTRGNASKLATHSTSSRGATARLRNASIATAATVSRRMSR